MYNFKPEADIFANAFSIISPAGIIYGTRIQNGWSSESLLTGGRFTERTTSIYATWLGTEASRVRNYNFNPLKPAGNYTHHLIYSSATLNFAHRAYLFRLILTLNSDYFLKQPLTSWSLCNGEVPCFLRGTDWILKYYLYELRPQRVKGQVLSCDTSHLWCNPRLQVHDAGN
jgi:hypothetical protein